MTARLSFALVACLVLALPPLAAHAETTGKGPAPEATNPAPNREMNQTDRQEAMPPGKDTGPDTTAPAQGAEANRTDDEVGGQRQQGSGGPDTATPRNAESGKPAR